MKDIHSQTSGVGGVSPHFLVDYLRCQSDGVSFELVEMGRPGGRVRQALVKRQRNAALINA